MERMTEDLDRRIRKGHERLDVVSKDVSKFSHNLIKDIGFSL